MAKFIKASGEILEVTPKTGTTYSLEELQGFVDGLIELVYLEKGAIMVVNEEGLWEKPFNVEAAVIAGFEVFGDVLVCEDKEIE